LLTREKDNVAESELFFRRALVVLFGSFLAFWRSPADWSIYRF
jgi:hypothetical protein